MTLFKLFRIFPIILTVILGLGYSQISNADTEDCSTPLLLHQNINKKLVQINPLVLRADFDSNFKTRDTLNNNLRKAYEKFLIFLKDTLLNTEEKMLFDFYLKNIIFAKNGAIGESYFSPEIGIVLFNSDCQNLIGDFLTRIHESMHLIQWIKANRKFAHEGELEKSHFQIEIGAMLAEFIFLSSIPKEIRDELLFEAILHGHLYGKTKDLIRGEIENAENLAKFSENFRKRSHYTRQDVSDIHEQKWLRHSPMAHEKIIDYKKHKKVVLINQKAFKINNGSQGFLDRIIFWR